MPWKTKRLLLKVLLYSGIARAVILFVPFKKYKKYIGIYNKETPFEIDLHKYKTIKQVSWAVNIVCSHTPWESKCLVQALTAQRILKGYNIENTLYLGVNKDSSNNMLAHAWLRSGQVFVTGGYNRDEYVEVGKFSSS